ncbi:MAG: ABC transporter permease [Phycisphaerae bacterium]|nr:ABC transporter permease [Phycisphaerae bacterium]
MIAYILRRLRLAALTILGVMLLTFLLFRVIAGDIAAAHVGQKATDQQKADWRHKYGYDKPLLLNLHEQFMLTDATGGASPFHLKNAPGTLLAERLAMVPVEHSRNVLLGRYILRLSAKTPLEDLTGHESLIDETILEPTSQPATQPTLMLNFHLSDGSTFSVDCSDVKTCGDLIEKINQSPENKNRVHASIRQRGAMEIFDSQFFHFFLTALTFDSYSLVNHEKLTSIIAQRAPKSLALTIPVMALGWLLAMVISSFVAYFRGTWLDKLGVFLSVLGMCVPYLAFMIYGQWLMFKIAPSHAYGLMYRGNIYVPIAIAVIAGLGGSVRFYRTVILNEVHQDYVRTARAKGAGLATILFKHVLKNCMLPILTNLILTIPFLIMGNLLLESYFGIPGLGDLMLSSINGRDEPILSGLVFLTALIYTLALLITDLCYAVFDPRIRLQ